MATKKKIEWPTAAVLVATVAALTVVYILVPDHRAEIATVVGVSGSVVLAFMRAVLGRES